MLIEEFNMSTGSARGMRKSPGGNEKIRTTLRNEDFKKSNQSPDKKSKCFILIISLFIQICTNLNVSQSLRIISIDVPTAVMNGSQVVLACNYELQGDQLYSIKWYKNYVEFYRYQPKSMGDQSQDGETKQGFALAGINLDVSKSNNTHVHLNQTSLASEGTYKCEISADSPSFTTISGERQMKIYVLPKQKLTIVDNSPNGQQQLLPLAINPRQSLSINDALNFTCTFGPSKPRAKLFWLLNETPVPETSKWLSASQSANQEQVALTIAFRLQPAHFQHQQQQQNNKSVPQPSENANQQRYLRHPANQFLKLSCMARLSFEFSTQTTILVSGGKASITSGGLTSSNRLPAASSLQASETLTTTAANSGANLNASHSQVGAEFDYRWPRPLAALNRVTPGHRRQSQNFQRNGDSSASTSDDFDINQGLGSPQVVGLSNGFQRHFLNWSPKELEAQAKFIESRLKRLRPNDLEAPQIEARLIERPELGATEAPSSTESEESGDDVGFVSGDAYDRRATILDQSTAAATTMPRASGGDTDGSVGGYELNDLVEFTCKPREDNSPLPVLQANLRFTWLINDQELGGNVSQINYFDGKRFSFVNQNYQPLNSFATSSNSRPLQPLLIEFSPSLFQAKELNLKCRIDLEQTLIEYQSDQILISSSNQHNFVQANSEASGKAQANPKGLPSSSPPSRYNVRLRNIHNNGNRFGQSNNRRHNQNAGQQQASSSGAPASGRADKFVAMNVEIFIINLLLFMANDIFPINREIFPRINR